MNSNTPHELANLRGATADRHLTAQAHDATQARLKTLKAAIFQAIAFLDNGEIQQAQNVLENAIKQDS